MHCYRNIKEIKTVSFKRLEKINSNMELLKFIIYSISFVIGVHSKGDLKLLKR